MDQETKENTNKMNQGSDKIPKFLKILYQLLENKTYKELISWSEDGRVVIINKPEEFADNLLPVYFKHNNYSSFVRQLNLYSFRKKKRSPHENAFVHAMFLKGRQDLLKYVKRKCNNAAQDDKCDLKLEICLNGNSEYNEMFDENMSLQRVRKDMTQKIETIERTLKDLASENETLQQQCRRKRQNEHLLKKVINQIAKIHGRHQIKELIESMPLEDDSLLTLSSEHEKTPERKEWHNYRIERTNSFPKHLCASQSQEIKTKAFPDHKGLQSTWQRTVSSVSTMPELNDSFNYYHNFDQIIDQNLRCQSNSSDFGLNVNFGLENFPFFEENRKNLSLI